MYLCVLVEGRWALQVGNLKEGTLGGLAEAMGPLFSTVKRVPFT